MGKKLSVILPSYNTPNLIDNLIEIREVVKEITPQYEIILVNDGSIEFPPIVQNEYIKVITNNKNMGKGYSLIKAFKKAQGEIICFIDSDLQIPALTLRGYYKIMRGSRYPDILIGSKRHYNSKIDYPLLRRVYSFGFQTMNRLMFGLKLLDTQTGVKFFKKDVLKDILPELRINGFAIDLEILSLAQMKGYKILEAPVHINESFSSTINIKAVLKMLIDSIKIWWRFKFNILKGGKKWKKIK